MKRRRRFLDQCHPGQIGARTKPQLDQIIAPVTGLAGKALEDCGATTRTHCNEAARVHRTAGFARSQVHDLDGLIQGNAGREV